MAREEIRWIALPQSQPVYFHIHKIHPEPSLNSLLVYGYSFYCKFLQVLGPCAAAPQLLNIYLLSPCCLQVQKPVRPTVSRLFFAGLEDIKPENSGPLAIAEISSWTRCGPRRQQGVEAGSRVLGRDNRQAPSRPGASSGVGIAFVRCGFFIMPFKQPHAKRVHAACGAN
jgi:hypothetical protein